MVAKQIGAENLLEFLFRGVDGLGLNIPSWAPTPALLTRMSSFPNLSLSVLAAASRSCALVTSSLRGKASIAFCFKLGSSFFRGLQSSSGYYDGHALLPQLTGSFKTDSTIGARDERDFSCQLPW